MSASLAVVLLGLLAFVTAGAAQAGDGSYTDPDDSNAAFDMREITWTNDAETITYTVDSYQDFPVETERNDLEVFFFLDWHANAGIEACAAVRRDTASTNGMKFEIRRTCDTGAALIGTGTVTKAGAELTMSYARALLAQAFPSAAPPASYTFTVSARHDRQGDQAPVQGDRLAHDLQAPNSTTTTAPTTTSTTAAPTTTTSTTRPPATTTTTSTSTTVPPTTTSTTRAPTTTTSTTRPPATTTTTTRPVTVAGVSVTRQDVLPRTGNDAGDKVRLALSSIVVGAMLVVASRRRPAKSLR